MEVVVGIAYFLVILIVSIMLHEMAHGIAALKFGDTTAKDAGRITLNPIPHIDPIGSILVPGVLIAMAMIFRAPMFIIGWAKPVPVDPSRYSNFRVGTFWVSIAGVLTNFLIAGAAGLIIRLYVQDTDTLLFALLAPIVLLNVAIGFFNLIPMPPLDGSGMLSAVLGFSRETQAKINMFFFRYRFMIFMGIFMLMSFGAFKIFFQGVLFVFSFITGVSVFS